LWGRGRCKGWMNGGEQMTLVLCGFAVVVVGLE